MSSIRSHTLLTFRALRPYPARRLLSTTVTNRADTLRDRPSQPIYEGGDLGSAAGEEEPKKLGSIRNAAFLTVGGIGLAVAGYFAFRTDRPEKAAKVADANNKAGKK